MVVKIKSRFVCQSCAASYPKWQGQCRQCDAWNTLVEEPQQRRSAQAAKSSHSISGYAGDISPVTKLQDIDLSLQLRFSTGLSECDQILGGGLVEGQVVLLSGDPGVGKSTLLLQVLAHLSQQQQTLYVTGEESLQQIAGRAKRLGYSATNISLMADTCVERIIAHAKRHKPQVMVVDSIQTMFTEEVTSAPGSVSQVRETTAILLQFVKQHGIILLLVGHVTKEGHLAGPRVLEHMVDTVLYFEGSQDSRYRAVRACKNRFGAVNALAIFAMTETGLKQLANPSAIFLARPDKITPGSVVMVTWEGTRPLLLEIQALVDDSDLPQPRRVTVGCDQQRLAMLLAILHRHAGVSTSGQDVFVNVVGGMRLTETAADLAVMLALVSSLRGRAISEHTLVFGEVGLSGEVRPVSHGVERLQEAAKHGFTTAIIPKANKITCKISNMSIHHVSHIEDALQYIS